MNAEAATPNSYDDPKGLWRSIGLIWTLTWMNFLPRSPRDGMRLFWVFAEPAGQLGIMMVIFTMIGRTASYGNSFSFFLLTGIVMLTLYRNGSDLVRGAVLAVASRTRLATIGMYHEAIARILFNLIVAAVYTTLLAWALGEIEDIKVMPRHPWMALEAFLWCGLLAFGVGLMRACATRYFPTADRVYRIASRGLLFISGIFFVPSFMAPQIREYLVYNPLLHVIEMFRQGMYEEYPTIVFSMEYLSAFSLASIGAGLAITWSRRRDFFS